MRHPTKDDWLKMAEAFDVARKKRTKKQLQITICQCGWCLSPRLGICEALDDLGLNDGILETIKASDDYWWPTTDEGDRERAFFCIMMAVVGKDMMGMLE